MKTIYIQNLLKNYLKYKVRIIIFLVLFVFAFGLLGIRQTSPEKISEDLAKEVQQYEDALAQYDNALASIQETIDITQEQVEQQQKYCDESIYMQIDPSDVKMVSVQYMIRIPEMNASTTSNRINYILNAWSTYINSGNLRVKLAENSGISSPRYLSELVSFSTTGNIMTIAIKHYDMEQAVAIMDELQSLIADYKSQIEEVLEPFELTVIDYAQTSMADIGVQNTQNTNLGALKGYKSGLTDAQNKLVSQQTTRDTYERQYKPIGVNTESPKKTFVKYCILGLFAGIIIPLAIYALYYILSNRIKCKEELLAAELGVLATFSAKEGYRPTIERLLMELELLAKRNQSTEICLFAVGDSNILSTMGAKLTEELKALNIDVVYSSISKDFEGEYQRIIDVRNIVFLVEAGCTTYAQLEEQIQFSKRFNMNIWGSILAE